MGCLLRLLVDRVGSIPKEKISQERLAESSLDTKTLLASETPKHHWQARFVGDIVRICWTNYSLARVRRPSPRPV